MNIHTAESKKQILLGYTLKTLKVVSLLLIAFAIRLLKFFLGIKEDVKRYDSREDNNVIYGGVFNSSDSGGFVTTNRYHGLDDQDDSELDLPIYN